MIVTKIIAIEQPELHLHPRIQSSFGVMLANLIANMQKDNDIRFVIETHSEAIINAIGSMVQSERLSQDKVNVVIFNGEEEGLDQYVVESQFDNNGYLSNWPVGFFM
jgi:predicted ATPase